MQQRSARIRHDRRAEMRLVNKIKPNVIFYIVLVFIALSFFLTYLIDIVNLFGIKEQMIQNLEVPFFWHHWFTTPVEIPLQWILLALTALFFMLTAGIAYERQDRKAFYFLILLSAGLLLMLIEDAGDVRHAYRRALGRIVVGETSYGYFGTIFELFYFAFIAAIMVYALWKYKDVYWRYNDARKYLFIGYIFYAIGVSASFIGNVSRVLIGFNVYEAMGGYILKTFFIRDEITKLAYEIASKNSRVDYNFMNYAVEESLELIGAGALLVAGIYFFNSYRIKVSK